jgi:hypothetical protein
MRGTSGGFTYLPIIVSGGARSAAEVTAQTAATPSNSTGEPDGAMNGSSTKAAHDTTVRPSIQRASAPKRRAMRSAAMPTTMSLMAKTIWSAIRM